MTPYEEDMGTWWDTVKAYDPTGWTATTETAIAAHLPQAVAVAAGASLGPDAYNSVPDFAKATPSDVLAAYDQAMYWLAFGQKRANYDQKTSASGQLGAAWNVLLFERGNATPDLATAAGLMCRTVGYGCPTKGRAEVLQYASAIVKSSQLGQSDKDKISQTLASARRSVLIQQALPVIVAAGIGAVAGRWLYKRYR